MIRITRSEADAPAAWLEKARAEREAAIAAYRAALQGRRASRKKGAALAVEFKFSAYRDEQLRDALNRAYGFKCAYCESHFGATQPVAVEHYRPKNAVMEDDRLLQPGYYWLAATWDNLLPSCTDCNSPRRQVEDGGQSRVRGKGNYFPLVPGTKRARSPGGEAREAPLLLHPEEDAVEVHLEFLAESERLGIVRAALVSGGPSARGEASIEVYALDRPRLVVERQNAAKRLLSHLRNTRNSLRRHREDPANEELREEYELNLQDLREMIATDKPHTGMLRAILRKEFPDQGAVLEALARA